MSKKDPRNQSSVKKRPQTIDTKRLKKLRDELESLEFDLSLPKGIYKDHPDWYAALENPDHPHPIDQEVERTFKSVRRLKNQRTRLLELSRTFRDLLPSGAAKVQLRLEDAFGYLRSTRQMLYFNAGVQAGQQMDLVKGAFDRAGIDTDSIERTGLLVLSRAIADLAKVLSPKEPRS